MNGDPRPPCAAIFYILLILLPAMCVCVHFVLISLWLWEQDVQTVQRTHKNADIVMTITCNTS